MGTIGILGTVHTNDLRDTYNYSLEKMEQLILAFKPDIICGEVRPEDWKKYQEDKGYERYLGPSEYRKSIIPLCERHDIAFVPVDWFEFDLASLNYYRDCTELEKEQFNKKFEEINERFFALAHSGPIPFNNSKLDELIREKKHLQERINPYVHNIYWTCRNQIMVERIKKVMEYNNGKRILCTVGCEHNYFYYDQLGKSDWHIVYPLK